MKAYLLVSTEWANCDWMKGFSANEEWMLEALALISALIKVWPPHFPPQCIQFKQGFATLIQLS